MLLLQQFFRTLQPPQEEHPAVTQDPDWDLPLVTEAKRVDFSADEFLDRQVYRRTMRDLQLD